MTNRLDTLLRWSPRVLGIVLCLFVSVFALDAFEEGKPLLRAIPDFLLHLIPSAAVVGVVALSWRREWFGGILFTVLGLAYAYMSRAHLNWTAAIALPLLTVGTLYLVSWRHGLRAR